MKKTFTFLFFLGLIVTAFGQQKPEGLFIRSKAPDFKAEDQNGNKVSLKDLRKKGTTVVLFYRGNWCPFCNRQLKKLQDSLQFITDKGATLIAITPETKEGIDKTIEKTGASFPILYDAKMSIAKAYGVDFLVESNTVNRYKMSGVDLLKLNAQQEASLPVPAVYIIDKEGTITFRYFDENYRNRISVAEILAQL